ncbi:MAG: hypothetical protein ABIA67_02675, partial [Candidatus Margulisiibacteriota bacterium]
VIGGIAVNLYGIQRATGDIDLMLAMDEKNLLKFVAITKKLGLTPKVPVKAESFAKIENLKKWRKEKNMKVFTFIHPDNPYIIIDIMTEDYIPFDEAYKKKKTTTAWGITLSVISIEDLIKLKKISGREIDLADIESLEKFGKKL